MSGILSISATIWKFQIVRFGDIFKGNNSVIPDSSQEMKNAGNPRISARSVNGAILDHIVDANKMVVLERRIGI